RLPSEEPFADHFPEQNSHGCAQDRVPQPIVQGARIGNRRDEHWLWDWSVKSLSAGGRLQFGAKAFAAEPAGLPSERKIQSLCRGGARSERLELQRRAFRWGGLYRDVALEADRDLAVKGIVAEIGDGQIKLSQIAESCIAGMRHNR